MQNRGSKCSLTRAMDGCIVRCGIISCYLRNCKALLVCSGHEYNSSKQRYIIQLQCTLSLLAVKKMKRRTWHWTCRRWACRVPCSRSPSSWWSVVQCHWLLHALSTHSVDERTPAMNSAHAVETTPRERDRTCYPAPFVKQLQIPTSVHCRHHTIGRH